MVLMVCLKHYVKFGPHSSHQRCLFHIFVRLDDIRQVDPKTLAGKDLYSLAKALFNVKTMDQAFIWINELSSVANDIF